MVNQDLQGLANQVAPGAQVANPDAFLEFVQSQGLRQQAGLPPAQVQVADPSGGDGGFFDFITRSFVSEGVLDTIRDQGFFGRIGANVLGELTNPIGIASTALLATGVGAPIGAGIKAATGARLAAATARGVQAGRGTRALAGAGNLAAGALTPVAQSARGLGPSQIIRSPGILGRSLAAEGAVAAGAIAGGGAAQEAGQLIPGPLRSVPGQLGLGVAGGVLGGGATAGAFNRVLDQEAALERAFARRDPVEEEIPELFNLRSAFRQAARSEADIAAQRSTGRARQFERGREAAAGIVDPGERAAAFRAAGGGRFVDRSRFEPLATERNPELPRRGGIPVIEGVTEAGEQFGLSRDLITRIGNRAFEVHGQDTPNANGAIQAFNELMLGEVPTAFERKLLRPVLGNAFIDQIETVISGRGTRAVKLALEIAGTPRTVAASFDLSSVLRQGGPLNISHPRIAARSFRTGMKALRNREFALEVNQQHLNNPNVRLVNSGLDEPDQLFLHSLDETQISRREETYISPIVVQNAPGIRHSEQFFATNLNSTRIGLLEQRLKTLIEQDPDILKPENAQRFAEWKRINNRFINALTGRGTLGFLENPTGNKAGQIAFVRDALSVSLWSPRLLVSRFQAVREALRATGNLRAEDPAIRAISREIAGDIAKYAAGVTAAISSLALLPGVSVEANPKSSDFGKVRLGDTRIDPWAGFQQVGRYATQFITGQRKSLDDGSIDDVERDRILGLFLRSKLAPGGPTLIASDLPRNFVLSGLTGGGRNFVGEPITGGDVTPGAGATAISLGGIEQLPAEFNTLIDQMVPLLARDIAEALESDGNIAGTTAGLGATFGLGTTSFGEGTKVEFIEDQRQSGPTNVFAGFGQ